MKKLFSLLVCAVVLLLVTSCGVQTSKEPATQLPSRLGHTETLQVISGYGQTLEYGDESYLPAVKVGYPYIQIAGEDAETYQRMNLILEENYEQKRMNKLDFLNLNQEDAKQTLSESPDYFSPYESLEQASVRRADSKVLSILYHGYTYTGGAHGFPYFWGESYDVFTGELLTLSDVVTQKDELSDLIWKELSEAYPGETWGGEVNLADWIEAEDVLSWTLDYNGITFYFNPYDLAAYAYGRQQVTLTFSEYPNLVKEEYQMIPVSYGMQLPKDCNFYDDVTKDGKADIISWNTIGLYDGAAETLTVTLNGTDYDFEIYAFDTEVTLLKTREGEYYLYVQNTMENDYIETHCYRLGEDVEHTGVMDGGMQYHYHKAEDMYFVSDVLTNPDSFRMSVRTQIASTVNGSREYRVGTHGIAVSDDPFYQFPVEARFVFTVLHDFNAELYDEKNHSAKGTVTVAEGEQVTYYATDNDRYIWLLLEDGTLCRKEVVIDDYLPTVDGYPVEEMFEGVLYAG